MTLKQAIKINTRLLTDRQDLALSEQGRAIALGNEALKGYQEGRSKPGGMFFHDLPGETEE